MNKETALLAELLAIMAKLRHPTEGCPWDLKQTFASIVPHTLEEAYELAFAIEKEDYDELKEELGDLLLQILFYSQIAKEQSLFDMLEVMETLKNKLISRHPHLFSGVQVANEKEVRHLWQSIKAKERKEKYEQDNRILSAIPHNLPGLSRAQKLQQRAAEVGFDWPSLKPVLEKLREEVEELEVSCSQNDTKAIHEELGDILFVCANIARHIQADAETIMREANAKFERRFNFIEENVRESGQDWQDFTLDEMEVFWQMAKKLNE